MKNAVYLLGCIKYWYTVHIEYSDQEARNPLISSNVGVHGKLLTNDMESFEYVLGQFSDSREESFKLECNRNLIPLEVFSIYRRRDTIKKLMDPLKNHIYLKPMCVWSENSVKGTLLLFFLLM
ncbi:MAG: hypothetical protein RBR05_04520 [Candidatus Methanomethylophilaceae archaeon]|nr:hypothetical protein [Candidatus Methanomethylophilaceae archaeon]MDY0224641.1 hypothetical protein [Candidatus Methanomethylophilaceae archaeon]